MPIDVNVDAGESFGRWILANDQDVFRHVSSLNLACGFHAGDPQTMERSVRLALAHDVAVGAHPGYPDLVGFGRRELAATPEEIRTDVLYQLGAVHAFLHAQGERVHHVKAHGSLYLRMVRDSEATRAVADAVTTFRSDLPLVVLGGTGGQPMAEAARRAGARVVLEAFPDRAYLADGTLSPRSRQSSVLDDPEQIAERAVAIARGQPIPALDGGTVTVEAQTLCLHGDNPHAPVTARAVASALQEDGVGVASY